MKTKFKPTNLGRPRPRNNGTESSRTIEAKSNAIKRAEETKTVRVPSNGVHNEKCVDSSEAATSSRNSLPSSPTIATPPSTTPPATPTSDYSTSTTVPTSSLTSMSPVSSATPPDTEAKPPGNTATPPITPPPSDATPSSSVATPPKTVATLPGESATFATSQTVSNTNTTMLDTLPSAGNRLDDALSMDVSLPLEIFANPSSCEETTDGANSVVKEATSSLPEKQTGQMGKGTTSSRGRDNLKFGNDDKSSNSSSADKSSAYKSSKSGSADESSKSSNDDKSNKSNSADKSSKSSSVDKSSKSSSSVDKSSKSSGSARSNGRVQSLKSAKKRTRKRPRNEEESQCGGSITGEDDVEISPVSKKSPARKKPRASTKIREAPDKTVMTMRELIYYNPSANPMSTKFDDAKKQDRLSVSASASPSPEQQSVDQDEDEEEADDEDKEEERIVPQLRIGEDGKIVVDQESLMVKTTAPKETEIISDDVVIDDPNHHTTSSSYRCRYKVTKWTQAETRTFFTALGKVGTDFTMMTLLLPKRSRKELKNKFKKEEKVNPHLITQALKVQQTRTIRT